MTASITGSMQLQHAGHTHMLDVHHVKDMAIFNKWNNACSRVTCAMLALMMTLLAHLVFGIGVQDAGVTAVLLECLLVLGRAKTQEFTLAPQ